MSKMTILLADDHALFRDGMRYVLQQLADEVEVVDAATYTDAVRLAEATPGLAMALLDLNMPGSEGTLSIRAFHVQFPDIPIVVVSGSDQRDDIERVMEFGAMGFISKMTSGKVMLGALRIVLDGGVYLPPQLLQQTVDRIEPKEDKRVRRANEHGLTTRQVEVLHCLAQGMSNKEIALHLGLAEGTVKIHVAAIFQVLRVGGRVEAVRVAQQLGLLNNIEAA